MPHGLSLSLNDFKRGLFKGSLFSRVIHVHSKHFGCSAPLFGAIIYFVIFLIFSFNLSAPSAHSTAPFPPSTRSLARHSSRTTSPSKEFRRALENDSVRRWAPKMAGRTLAFVHSKQARLLSTDSFREVLLLLPVPPTLSNSECSSFVTISGERDPGLRDHPILRR